MTCPYYRERHDDECRWKRDWYPGHPSVCGDDDCPCAVAGPFGAWRSIAGRIAECRRRQERGRARFSDRIGRPLGYLTACGWPIAMAGDCSGRIPAGVVPA